MHEVVRLDSLRSAGLNLRGKDVVDGGDKDDISYNNLPFPT